MSPPGASAANWRSASRPSCGTATYPCRAFNDPIVAGGKRYVVDCHWPDVKEILELDGWQGHKTRTAFREDRARDRKLGVAGYHVTRLTWNQLEDEPEAVAADLRALLSGPAPASSSGK